MDSVSKSELIKRIQAANPDLKKKDVENIVKSTFDSISDAIAAGEKVSILEFGTFATIKINEREGRSPQTGEPITIPAHKKVHFKVSKTITKRVNE